MPLSSGLLAFYRLESDATDDVGTIDLTATGSPTFGAGKVGNCAIYDGAGAHHGSSNSIFSFAGNDRSIALWVNADDFENSPGIVSNWAGAGGAVVQWLLWVDGTSLKFQIRDTGDVDHVATWASTPVAATWYFIVCTYNSATGDLKISVNDDTPVTANTGSVKTGTNSLNLAGRNAGAATWDGKIDSFGIWDRVLSANEITSLYNNGNGLDFPFPEGGSGQLVSLDYSFFP